MKIQYFALSTTLILSCSAAYPAVAMAGWIEDPGITYTLDSSVGIGTATPGRDLHIKNGSIVVEPTSKVSRGSYDYTEVFRGVGNTSDYIISVQDGTGRVQHYWNASPRTQKYLVSNEAAGKMLISPASVNWFTLSRATAGTAGDKITWKTHFVVKENGNVGINTTAPTAKLEVNGSFKTGTTLNMRKSSSHNVIEHTGTSGKLYLRSNVKGDTSGALILNDLGGNVGIGTANPGLNLHVHGTMKLTDDNTANTLLAATKRDVSGYAGGGPHLNNVLLLSTPYETTGQGQGRQGINFASPEIFGTESTYMYAHGSKNLRLGTVNDGYRRSEIELYNNNTSQGKIYFRTGTWRDPANTPASVKNVRMMIDHQGKVGIGTVEPTEKLQVDGNLKVNGNIVSDGIICIGNCTQ